MKKDKTFQDTPLWDCSLPMALRLDYLLGELTLEEKLQCLGTGCPKIERLGIREFYVGGEGAHGVQARHDQSFDKGEPQTTTVFPNPIGMSATWDMALMREAGSVVGNEARAVYRREKRGGLCLWAPTVDMERDPRWGRTEEAYGEDPYLTGKMASAYVQGMRGEDPFYLRCGATLKHFYANNVEDGRVWKSSSIDPRNKYEYYLEPFRRVVTEGGAEAIMTAYNEVNGVPCLFRDELQQLAKEQWGIHHIVCDGGDMKQTVEFHQYFHSHTETVAAALKAGMDCFTDDIGDVVEGAREAYQRGMITMEDIDRALRCHFGTLMRLGLFDHVPQNPYMDIGEEELNTKHNQMISYELAKESVVLLKNEPVVAGEKPLLPLSSGGEREKRLAVIGPMADVWYMDWYSGIPPYHVTPMEGVARCVWEGAGDGEKQSYKKNQSGEIGRGAMMGLVCESGLPQIKLACDNMFLGLLEDGKTVGLVPPERAEIFEVTLWDKKQATLRSTSTGRLLTTEDGQNEEKKYRKGIVTASSEEAFGWFVRESFHLLWEGDSFYEALKGGSELSLRAWNDMPFLLDGQGRLRVAEPECFVEDKISMESLQQMSRLQPILVREGIREAVLTATASDTVLLMAGAHPMINCKEEVDRQDIDLPLYQRELIRAVYQANPKIVLALITSIPFGIAWEKEHIPAIVTMASGSMELGNALADVLFGRAAPAGRLNMTWYRDVEQLPDMDDYDIIQQERTYQYFQGEVLYPFGHGLTYSPICYRKLQVTCDDEKVLRVAVEITNKGSCQTDEVVQIYIAKEKSVVKRAVRQLKAFERVKGIQPSESRIVSFEIPVEDLRYYDVIAGKMLLEPGEYQVQAAASSQDIRLRQSITLEGTRRGARNGLIWNAADHYDCSEGAVMWEGHQEYSCVASGGSWLMAERTEKFLSNGDFPVEDRMCDVGGDDDSVASMQLVYHEVSLTKMATELVLDGEMKAGGEVMVYLDDALIGKYVEAESGNLKMEAGFRDICIPVRLMIEQGREKVSYCLKLACSGMVKICRWRFR